MTVIWFALICLATGVAIRLVRRLPRLVFGVSLAGAALLAAVVLTAPSNPITFFGRTLTLDIAARYFIAPAVMIATTLAFFGPLTFQSVSNIPAEIIANSQGSYFFWALAPLAIAIALDSFPLAVFFWASGLVVLMLASHPQREGRVGGAAQFLLITIIASASLLLTNRLIDLYPLTPENTDLIRSTIIFLALGLGLLLAVFPFSIWLGPLADEMPVLAIAFLIGVAQPVGLWLLIQKMSEVAWLTDKSPLLTILLWGGLLTALTGALLAIPERRDGRWLAYLSLIPLGYVLAGLGLGTRLGLVGALLVMLSRAMGVTLIGGGISFVRHHFERRWQIVGGVAILAGGWALAGIPPMLGFAAQFSIYRDLAERDLGYVIALLATNGIALIVTLRAGWQVLSENRADAGSRELKLVPYLCAIVVVLLLGVLVITGLFPQLFATPLLEVMGNAAYLK
jgi:formate hydrogenlyase subunit 3/multisubunit Na+/H+ antiporter MnhD subunit